MSNNVVKSMEVFIPFKNFRKSTTTYVPSYTSRTLLNFLKLIKTKKYSKNTKKNKKYPKNTKIHKKSLKYLKYAKVL